jgi:hypothetical protein
MLRENEVRLAREIAAMEAEAEATSVQLLSQHDLGPRVLPPYARHHPAADSR